MCIIMRANQQVFKAIKIHKQCVTKLFVQSILKQNLPTDVALKH